MHNSKIKRMVGIALLMATIVVLQIVGGIIPPIAGFPITLVLIPVVMGAATYGYSGGGFLGGFFGLLVYINCVNGSDVGGAMVFQANPMLCFIMVLAKGILAGLASATVYKLLKNKNGYAAMLAASMVCPLVNTGIFILSMLLCFKDVLAAWAAGGDLIAYILSGLVLVNFLPELLINMAVSPGLQSAAKAVEKFNRG